MRILIIGGTRFIGAATVARLTELEHEVMVFNRGQAPAAPPDGVRRIVGEREALADHRAEIAAFAPDAVIHTIVLNEDHVASAQAVLRGITGRLVVLSSCDVYRAYGRVIGTEPGPPDPVPLTEDSPLREQLYPYRSKVEDESHPYYTYDKIPAERATLSDSELPGTVLRLPMVIGARDYQHRLFPYLRPMLDGRPALVFEEGYGRWRSTYDAVENVGEAIALAATKPEAAGRVYNVGDWHDAPVDTARAVKERMNWDGEIILAARSELPEALHADLDASQDLVCSAERLHEELGYGPVVSFDEGLSRAIAWEKETPPDPIPPDALNYEAVDNYLKRRSTTG